MKPFILTTTGLALSLLLPTPLYAAEMSQAVPLELEKPAYVAPWKRYKRWNQFDWKDFSNLRHEIPSRVSAMHFIDGSLNGDPANGKKLVADRKRGGSCFACHILPDGSMPGNIGPNLSMLGVWNRSDERLFNYIYDARQFNPNTVMPPWGAHGIFSKEEIKDIVTYLQTLAQPIDFKNSKDNPALRQAPDAHNHSSLDPFENPAMFSVDRGEELFEIQGPKEQSCQSCHKADLDGKFLTWAATMPKFETRLNKVIGIEEFVTRHARATTGAEYPAQSDDNLALAIYLRYLAYEQPITIDQSDANTQAAVKRGKTLTQRKIGQLNFACMDCHGILANRWIRGQYLVGMSSIYDHFPTYRTSRGKIWDIRKRFQWCGVSIRANELPPDAPEYGDIEMYLATINQGQKLNVPGIRH